MSRVKDWWLDQCEARIQELTLAGMHPEEAEERVYGFRDEPDYDDEPQAVQP